jgi:hypothetical protein
MSLKQRANALTEMHKKDQNLGVITIAERLDYPIDGLVDGQPVRISFLGDVTGFSTCYLCTDAEGLTTWVSLQDVRITERNYQPFSAQNQSAGLGQQGQGQPVGSSAR